jgi:uncharacterized protein YecE (DUF72 family)
MGHERAGPPVNNGSSTAMECAIRKMQDGTQPSLGRFVFRDLHPSVAIGTASDRYAGWIGQIYTPGRYEGRMIRRRHVVGRDSFVEEVLPVESVREYFDHFDVLEIDYTFYGFLLDSGGRPTQTHRVLESYARHLRSGDRIFLKVPQLVFARRLRRGGGYSENEAYLDPETFTEQFYEPALGLLGQKLQGLIFEQEYHRRSERSGPEEMAEALDAFFQAVPRDERYHVELRTESYLDRPLFDVLERHGVGQVLSHWTWLPPLRRQFSLAGKRFFNRGGQCVIRLMTPLGMRYEDAYAKAHPFDKLVDGMLQPRMIEETVAIMREAAENGVTANVIINNRAGGNAPLIALHLAQRFLGSPISGQTAFG